MNESLLLCTRRIQQLPDRHNQNQQPTTKNETEDKGSNKRRNDKNRKTDKGRNKNKPNQEHYYYYYHYFYCYYQSSPSLSLSVCLSLFPPPSPFVSPSFSLWSLSIALIQTLSLGALLFLLLHWRHRGKITRVAS